MDRGRAGSRGTLAGGSTPIKRKAARERIRVSVSDLRRVGLRTALSAAALLAGFVHQDCLAEATLQGANTLRLEYYDVGGDLTASPYPTEGLQAYDEIDLRFGQRYSPYHHLRGQATLLANDSAYRNSRQGGVLERFNLVWENGETRLPYRLEAGDQYGFFSPATLQRGIKGLALELQPRGAHPDRRQSLILLGGSATPAWRDFDTDSDFSAGLSYVARQADGGIALNLLNNRRAADPLAGSLARRQWVASLAGERAWELSGQHLELEGEVGRFQGDHDGASGEIGRAHV